MNALQTKFRIPDDIMDYIYFIIFTDNYNEVMKELNRKMDMYYLENIFYFIIDFDDFEF
jgi:hypothetical protein